MIELKPCPFCNGEAEFTTNQGYDKNCYVRCKECSAKARVIDVCVDYAAKEKAAELWNARVNDCDRCFYKAFLSSTEPDPSFDWFGFGECVEQLDGFIRKLLAGRTEINETK